MHDLKRLGDRGEIELQDLITDMTLTTIFINCMTLREGGTGATFET